MKGIINKLLIGNPEEKYFIDDDFTADLRAVLKRLGKSSFITKQEKVKLFARTIYEYDKEVSTIEEKLFNVIANEYIK